MGQFMRLTMLINLYIVHYLEVAFYGMSPPGQRDFRLVISWRRMRRCAPLKMMMCIAHFPIDTFMFAQHYTHTTVSHQLLHCGVMRSPVPRADVRPCSPSRFFVAMVAAFRGLRDRYPLR
jgi:hypothetical protein